MKKAVFLDRDGVINQKPKVASLAKQSENNYVKSWDEFRFLPGVIEAIKALNEKGYFVIVVTNQRGIARGLMIEKDLEEIHRRMLQELQIHGAHIDDIFYCPHDIKDNCVRKLSSLLRKPPCRKPQPDMLIQAKEKQNIRWI